MTVKKLPTKITRIIVEGPDCSGKSTLVERLKNKLRWDSKYLRHKNGEQFNRYLKEYSEEEIVLDRAHFSEEVYSTMWRGGSPFSKEQKEILDSICNINTLVIFAIPNLKTIENRYKSRNFTQQISFEELKFSRELFIEQSKKVKAIIYRSKDYEELEKLLKKVKEVVQ